MIKLYVMGIGYKPLDKRAREIILDCKVILASNRLIEVLRDYDEFDMVKDRIKVINNVDETIDYIKSAISHQPIVLLASGDPMFFGIGRRAIKEFGKDMVEILPDLSSIQMAFSRIKEPWDDAFLISLHGGPDPEKRRRLPYDIKDIPLLLQQQHKMAILTDKQNNPSEIAKAINSSPVTHYPSLILYVCERLGYADEKITQGTPEEIAGMTFSEPNVVIIKSIVNSQQSSVRFGLKEAEISHSKGLITKDEVRAVTIHRLRLPLEGVFWDIGAGSGSVSIEAARLYPQLNIFAVEKNKEQINHIRENKKRFNALNIEIISGEAPDALINLPTPDRVFIGGSSGRLKEMIVLIKQKMVSGIIVINATTIETLSESIQCLENNRFNVDASEVSVARSKVINGKKHLNALNPIFIISGEKIP
ncbi:precorrin-6y C5,15-methyltransferase (decarboxylating) subunit CbiE [bacterium]|nr:precorrin-6y C5,15-methyltransferase (decarboxylating) subunit CbiE [bacterium]MBU1753877.1 precorrin-6y C5,15-methyltransferase (decarboxylating) subunit CbiE [bacterium]